MQPPPRKVKPSAALKNIHADQVSKLQAKHQQECDLLEDIRTFFLRKAALEKEYAQGLQKITTQLLKREFPAQPDLSSEDGVEHKTVCTVWRSILEEADRMAKARLQAAEVYADKVAEPLKPAKSGKMQTVKKVLPQLSTIQAEVSQCVLDMVKSSKAYITENGIAHDARQKSLEAEDKLKRKSTGIFQSLAGLQKNAAKLRGRTETSEVKETAARNDYLLNLAAANAHHIRYYSTDLPDVMKTMDCDVYEKIQESLTVAGETAAEITQTETSSFQNIAVEAAKICRQFSHQCYLFQNPVFTNLVQYQFEPSHEDSCNKMSSDHGAAPDLEKEARKWATRMAKETRAVRDYYRQLTVLQNSKTADKASDSSSQENTNTDPEVKLEEIKQHIRKAETTKLKAEARLEALRAGGVNVDEWISQAQMESLAAEESGLARTPSQLSLRTESSGGHSMDDQEATYTHYDDDDDFIDDTFNTTGNSRSGRVYPIYCKALYDFEASNYDEMSIKTGEDLELIADGDGEGWIKAKNSVGQEGYIPETYVEQESTSTNEATTPVAQPSVNNVTNNFSTVPSSTRSSTSSQHSANAASTEGPTSPPDVQSPTSVDFTQDTTSSYSSGDLEVQQTTEVMTSEDHAPVAPTLTVVTTSASEIVWAKALYDYDGQTDEELSFLEGTLIKVLRKDDNGVDDGFWEGECNGSVGVFPSLVVEEIGITTPNDPASPGSFVDYSIPPPVHITLPTPDGEPPPPPPMVNGEECDEPLPPPPPVLELEDVNRFEADEDSQPMAPPPPVDLDQTQQKRVRFNTTEQFPSKSSCQGSTNYKNEITERHLYKNSQERDMNDSQHRQQTNLQTSLMQPSNQPLSLTPNEIAVKKDFVDHDQAVSKSDVAKICSHTPENASTSTPVLTLSRHQSLPNCNMNDNVQCVKKSPLPLRSKSMTLSQQQTPPGIPPPPHHSPKRQHLHHETQQFKHKDKTPQQPIISKSKTGGSVAHLPSSQNFVDKFLGSPPGDRRKIQTLPPPALHPTLPPPALHPTLPPPALHPTASGDNTNTSILKFYSNNNHQPNLKLESSMKRQGNFSAQIPPGGPPTHHPNTVPFSSPQNPHPLNHEHHQQQHQIISPSKTFSHQQMWQNFQPSSPPQRRSEIPQYHQQQQKSPKLSQHQMMEPFSPGFSQLKDNQHHHTAKQTSNGSLKNGLEINTQFANYQPACPTPAQQQTQQHQMHQQHYYSSKLQSYSKSLTQRQDKLPLCFDVDDDEWESEEGEESLV